LVKRQKMEVPQYIGIGLLAYAGVSVISIIPLMILFCLRKSVIKSLRFKFPALGFIAWAVLMLAMIAIGGVLMATGDDYDSDDNDLSVFIAILAVIYFIYFICCCVAPSFRATCHRLDVNEFDRHLQQLRETGVDLHYDIVASHTERHTYRDSKGNRRTETRTVVTYRGTRYVPVPFWVDLTGPLVIPPGTPFIRVCNSPVIEWCHGSDALVENIRCRIYALNAYRDKTVTVTTHVGVPGLIPNLILRSPLMDPTTCQKVRINPFIGILLTFIGYGGHHAFVLARTLPVVKHNVYKKASLVQPVFDDSWLQQYHVQNASMTPHGTVFNNAQMIESWDANQNVSESYVASQPMFVNPMPLYVSYDTAMQVELAPSAPEMPYMSYQDPNAPQPQAGYGPTADSMAAVPSAPSAPSAPEGDPGMVAQPDPNAMAAQPDPNAMGAQPMPAYPGQDMGGYAGVGPDRTV